MVLESFVALGKAVGGYIGAGIGYATSGGAAFAAKAAAVSTGYGIGSAVGGVVGLGGGVYASAALISSLSGGGDTIHSDRLPDTKNTTRDEGAPHNRVFGKRVRVPGHVVWTQYPRTHNKESNKSGKGPGGGDEYITHKYRQSIAVEWGVAYGRPIKRVLEVYANGDKVWSVEPDFDETATLSTTLATSVVYVGGSPTTDYYYHYVWVHSPVGGPDLTKLVKGKKLQMNGWTDADMNSGTNPGDGFEVINRDLNPDGSTSVKVLIAEGTSPSTNPGSVENDVVGVTIFQSQPTHSPKKSFVDVSHYVGTLDQTPDPEIVLREGTSNMPGMIDRIYSVFEQWRLEHYGNVPPQALEAVLEVDDQETLQNVVDAICETHDLDATKRDTSALAGVAVDGYLVQGRTSGVEALAPLMSTYNVVAYDDGGVLTFVERADLPALAVAADELVAHALGEAPSRDVRHRPTGRRELPAGVQVTYMDPEKDYQAGSTTYIGQGRNGGVGLAAVDLRVVMTSKQAQEIARRLFWTYWTNSHAMDDLRLPPSRLGQVRAGTVVTFPEGSLTWDMLATSVVCTLGDVLVLSGFEEQPEVFTHVAALDDPPS